MASHATGTLAMLGIAATVAGCAGGHSSASRQASPSLGRHHPQRHARLIPGTTISQTSGPCGTEPIPRRYFGVITNYPGSPQYNQFISRAGVRPTLDDFFFSFGEPWNSRLACLAIHHGAMPLIQLNLRHISAAEIASGRTDGYVARLAGQIKRLGSPIVVSVGHEMNGNWYSWGWHNTPVGTFVRMWRRIHQIFARSNARNVIWMWTVDRATPPATNPGPWWPGRAYVNWVGIDGHNRLPSDRYSNVYGPTIADVRRITDDPILISEAGVVAGSRRPAQIADLYRAVYDKPGMLGVLYLNLLTRRIDWRLLDPASVRAFVAAVRPYMGSADG
jgi:Glycosyl hydrolase family 26